MACAQWPALLPTDTAGILKSHSIQKTSALHNRNDITTKQVRPLSLPRPRCHSPKVAPFHHAMKVGAAIGNVGSVARGVSAALAGGQAGVAGPV